MPLTIHFINVGQGDATYLCYEAPDQTPRHLLVDGGRANVAPRLIAYLQAQGVERLHLVVATHIDDDHISGLADIFATFPVARFWGPDPTFHVAVLSLLRQATASIALADDQPAPGLITVESVNTYARLYTLALGSGALVEHPTMGYDASRFFAGLELRVMGPPPQFAAVGDIAAFAQPPAQLFEILSAATNNSSIVIRAGVGGQHVLLTGDAEFPAWRAMIEQWGAGLHARVLKISHHGSPNGTNAESLRVVRPRQAVISVGPNSYGHPDPRVLRLVQPPIQLYRTDKQGDIVIQFKDAEAIPAPTPPRPRGWWQRLLDWLSSKR